MARANVPGGGTGTGANVTLTDNGTTVTLSNGIVSIPITKASANISSINYTHSNGSSTVTTQMLSGGYNGGLFYWEFGGFGDGGSYTYALVADPLRPTGANAVGDYAEIAITRGGATSGAVEMHFSMRRGSPGFYVTPIWIHGSADAAQGLGETRTNIYAGSLFNWMSVDATRNRQMQVSSGSTATGVDGAPKEVSRWTNGIYQGQYEDKYKYSADFATQRVWGWSSVTTANPAFTGSNVGLWDVLASAEYYNGGPTKRELMCHIGTTILNMFNGTHYGGGTDGDFAAGEVWSKAYGPYFVYCNSVASNTADAAGALYADAQAQAAAEGTAWPYAWFSNSRYAAAAGRGTVTGKLVINDSGNPNASAAGMWVGVIQQPATSNGVYDFQKWAKPYQFWVKTDAAGNFTIPNVIAGTNYTLYAFGPGAAGTFQSQTLTGGSAPLNVDLPTTPFSVAVTGGNATALGNVTWTPARIGPTVFEIGAPDRNSTEFRHGDDYWVSDKGPGASSPSPNWGKFLNYPFDFSNGVNYTLGVSRWTTDWNYVQPVVLDGTGTYNSSASTINFNLPTVPNTGAQAASLYLAQASNYQGPVVVTVNGTNLGNVTTTATPRPISSTGYFASWSGSGDYSDTTIREGPHGCFSDERITFAGNLLKQGANTITIRMRKSDYFANHAMYDYVRLELLGYTPPAPANVAVYPGNGRTLLTWPATPGATSYNVLRSTTSGSGYTAVASGVTGPVCGSGPANATYIDATAANGTAYYYVVQSVNPAGISANSAQSTGVTPSAGVATSAPTAPANLAATASDGAVTLNWSAVTGANYCTVKRSTLVSNSGSGTTYVTLGTITLSNGVTGASFTDTSVSNGSTYAYAVSATNAAGTSGEASGAGAVPRPPAPTVGPASLTATALQNSGAGGVQLNWSTVSGATGYIVQFATSANGPYTLETSTAPLTYTDGGLSPNTTYYYQVASVNSGGTSPFVSASTTTPPAAPASLTTTAASSRVALSWAAVSGAASYTVGRATISGGPYTTIASAVTSTAYLDRAALNGTTYYYVVAATGVGGTGAATAEVSATPAGAPTVLWTGGASTTWDTATTNWSNGGTAATYANGNAVAFDDTATNTTVKISGTVTPDSLFFDDDNAYTFNAAGLSGSAGLSKFGAGTLSITGTNSFSGGTTLAGGAIAINGGASNGQNGLGTGTITLEGGTLTMNGYTGSNSSDYGTLSNPVNVPAGASGVWQFTQRGSQSGPVTGPGTLTLQVNYIRGNVSGDWSGFTGQLNVLRTRTGTTVDNLRINANTGFGTAALNLGPYVQTSSLLNASNSFVIGELSSNDSTAQLAGIIYNNTTPGSYTATYVVGGRNTNATFAGSIVNGASPSVTAITKTGTGTWTLSGACSYTGPTTVNAGTLKISGSVANTTALTVASGATLRLDGGRLSVAGALTNNGVMRLSGAASLSTTGTFTNNGVLDLINGPQTLPANFVNNGVVLTGSLVAVSSVTRTTGGACTVVVPGYAGHTYQLQNTSSLTIPNWQNTGNSQTVPGTQSEDTQVTLSDNGATGSAMFYRVVVTPAP